MIKRTFEKILSIPNKVRCKTDIHFTLKELEVAMKLLKNKQSPGDDKLPNKLFIHARKDMEESLLKIISTFYNKAETPSNWKSIVIKMLFKGKGKRAFLKNWRGIFLTVALSKLFKE